MSNIAISDLPIEFAELNKLEANSITGGCEIKYRLNGKVKSITNCSAEQIKAVTNPKQNAEQENFQLASFQLAS
ncbi:hypothetical protein [Myxosarcina sp. GI1]|uniref:hypothetical protein n=1 Tax=Myxosarcina sp. GI1 TaxID=1541065 RepID=UPI00055D13C9|nr:hypothetical protein [Myxosarcina sp. GI1]